MEVSTSTGINKAIRWHRRSLDLTQRQLARTLGVGLNTVLRWEKGQNKPSIDQLIILAKLFGVTEQELLYPTVIPLNTTKEVMNVK